MCALVTGGQTCALPILMIAKYDETLLDPEAPVLKAADFTFGNCEWPYAEEMGDTHPVVEHLNDDVEGEDLFIPGDPEADRLKGRQGFRSKERRGGKECVSTCIHRGAR